MREHGYARYRLDGCRCYVCAFARSEYDQRRDAMIKAGTWQPFVPIDQVQTHIRQLKRQCGMGDRQIAALAECDRKWVRDVAHGIRHDPSRGNPPLTKVRADRAAAVLAIPCDILWAADGAYVPAWRVWRWIEKLRKAGYSKARISAEIGQGGRALQLSRKRVTGRNARAVYRVYLQEFGEQRTRDDVDWVMVQRAAQGEHTGRLTPAERREAITLMHGWGLNDSQMAARLHTEARAIFRIRHEELNLASNYEYEEKAA